MIVTWNSADIVLPCLHSLEQHPPSSAWEAIVVDNGSRDNTAEAIRTQTPWANIIANARNRGLASAINQGLMASSGEVVVISNPDVLFHDGAIDALCDVLDRRPRAAFAIPQLVQEDGHLQASVGNLPRLREALWGSLFTRSAEGGFWWRSWKHDEELAIEHGQEACYAVRRDAVADVGPLDEGYPLDWEGIEWSARMRDAGWEIWFCPRARITHLGGASIRKAQARWIVQSHWGMYRYFKPRNRLLLRPVLWLAVAARATAKLGVHIAGHAGYDRAHRRSRLSGPGDPVG